MWSLSFRFKTLITWVQAWEDENWEEFPSTKTDRFSWSQPKIIQEFDMATRKANVIFGDINRNITSKLMGRNSMAWLCPFQTSGLAQCLAHRQHSTNTLLQMNGRHIFRWTLKLRWQGIWRQKQTNKHGRFNLEKTKKTHVRVGFQISDEISHLGFLWGVEREGPWSEDTQR